MLLTANNCSRQKAKDAKEDAIIAKLELDEENAKFLIDVNESKDEAIQNSKKNKQYLSDFKAQLSDRNLDAKSDYSLEIAKLDARNDALVGMMLNYVAERKDNWESFKSNYNYEMNKLQLDLGKLVEN